MRAAFWLVASLISVANALMLPQQPRRGVPRDMRAPRDGDSTGHLANPTDAGVSQDWDEQLQQALDRPLIDPWSETPDECSLDKPAGCVPGLESFKEMIRNDYYMAETLWAGLFCSLCVSFAMQLTKAYVLATMPLPYPPM